MHRIYADFNSIVDERVFAAADRLPKLAPGESVHLFDEDDNTVLGRVAEQTDAGTYFQVVMDTWTDGTAELPAAGPAGFIVQPLTAYEVSGTTFGAVTKILATPFAESNSTTTVAELEFAGSER